MTRHNYRKYKEQLHPLHRPNPKKMVVDATPHLYFAVQHAFQDVGVKLVILETGDLITGQVFLQKIGLIGPATPPKYKRVMGYVQTTDPCPGCFEPADLEAVLEFDPDQQSDNDPLFLTIRVIDEKNVEFWKQIALSVADAFVIFYHNHSQTEVEFTIVGLSCGGDSAKNAALRTIQRFGFKDHAVSDLMLELEDDILPDDEEYTEDN